MFPPKSECTNMFGILGRKKYQPTVTPEDKAWIETSIIWLIEAFGLERLRVQPFIAPSYEAFPYTNLKDSDQFEKLFEQLCLYWDVNPHDITVELFDDIKSKQWTSWRPEGKIDEPGGLFSQINTTEGKRFNIQLAKSNLDDPQLLIYVIAHELAHVKLLGGNYIDRNDLDMEPLTDLACIFFGFGVFIANSVQTRDTNWIGRTGYLPNEIISYTNALVCYITEHDEASYYAVLNSNTNSLFRGDYEFLKNTNDTLLTKSKVQECEETYTIGSHIDAGFNSRDYEKVIEYSQRLLDANPQNAYTLNNVGYALLMQSKYEEAIQRLTEAIDIDPFADYPYCNRGFCKLQLGDLENAYADLHHSLKMNPENPLAWRNNGAYYLAINEYDKALAYFKEAEKIDAETEMINYCIGQSHLKLGNLEVAQEYLDKSKALNESNDLLIE